MKFCSCWPELLSWHTSVGLSGVTSISRQAPRVSDWGFGQTEVNGRIKNLRMIKPVWGSLHPHCFPTNQNRILCELTQAGFLKVSGAFWIMSYVIHICNVDAFLSPSYSKKSVTTGSLCSR